MNDPPISAGPEPGDPSAASALRSVRPFPRPHRRWWPKWPLALWLPGSVLIALSLAFLFAPLLAPYDPLAQNLSQSLAPRSVDHWFGTDALGRDVFSRILYGGRYTAGITLVATTIGGAVGTMLGLIGGYFRRSAEMVIMRWTDVLLAFPSIIIAFIVVAILGVGTRSVVFAMAIYTVPLFTRFSYGATRSIAGRDYVEAARTRGAGGWRILLKHVLPNILPEMTILWTLRLGVVALIVSSLSFIGLGVQPPSPEWGAMLSQDRTYMRTNPWLVLYPGLAISLLIVCFNLIGDGLRDLFEPGQSD